MQIPISFSSHIHGSQISQHLCAGTEEQTSGYLHSAAVVLLDKYEGSLYKLRDAAKKEPEEERKLLTEIKGMAKVTLVLACFALCLLVFSFATGLHSPWLYTEMHSKDRQRQSSRSV